MASWLKAAEDLFEVVDRRAKLVARDSGDEQPDIQPLASNGQESQPKHTKSKAKPQTRPSARKSPTPSTAVKDQNDAQTSPLRVSSKGGALLSVGNEGSPSSVSETQTNTEKHQEMGEDSPSVPASETQGHEADNPESNQVEVQFPTNGPDTSTSNGEFPSEKTTDVPIEHPPSSLPSEGIVVADEDHPLDAAQKVELKDEDTSSKSEQGISQPAVADSLVNSEIPSKVSDVKGEVVVSEKKQHMVKTGSSPSNIQDQLEEAQGLLKNAISTGPSKEARLARVCAGLHSRLQEYKAENAQLEELLIAERELTKSYEDRIKQLQQDLSTSKSEVTRIESNMAEALAAKNSEIEAVVSSTEALKKQAALSEGSLASLQANMEAIMRNRELTETRMMQAMREELASVERRAEEERAAHNATKMAGMEREVELEHRAIEASTALARVQRVADERTAKAAELEQTVALLEVECSSLNQELQDMEARARRGQKKSPEEATQKIQAWQEEVERARQGQRDAESKLSSSEAELQKMRVEMAAMKRDAEHYSRQEHMELEKRYRELTDLLYYKQTQLESMASEKAAAEFQLEKELKRLQEAQVEAEKSRVPRRASSSWEEDSEMKALEPLPLYHRHMVGASMQLQNAAKLLDSGAARATRFLWRYPKARIILLFYLVFVHFFLMYLLHHLQEQADTLSAREVAESMGLAATKLP